MCVRVWSRDRRLSLNVCFPLEPDTEYEIEGVLSRTFRHVLRWAEVFETLLVQIIGHLKYFF